MATPASVLIGKTWQVHRVSPPHHFRPTEASLRRYATDFAEMLRGRLGEEEEQGWAVAGHELRLPVQALPLALFHVAAGAGGTRADKKSSACVLCPARVLDSVSGQAALQYTLVLTKGSKDAVAQFFLWLESRFDCFVNVAALRVAPVHIEALAHEWSVLGWGSAAGNDANDSDGDGGDGGGGGGGGDGGDGGGGGGGNSSKRRGAKRTAAAAAPAAPPAAKRRVPAAKPLQCRYVMPPSIRGVRAITLTAPPESMAPLVARHVWRASARVPVWRLTSPRPWSVPDVLRDFFRAQTGISLGHASMDLAHTPVAVISADAKLKVLAERHLAAVLAGVARVCQPPARAAAAAEVEEEDTRKVVAPTHPLLQQSPAM